MPSTGSLSLKTKTHSAAATAPKPCWIAVSVAAWGHMLSRIQAFV